MKFKVGDRVRIISKKDSDEYTTYGFKIGNIYKITEINKDRLTIFDTKKGFTGFIYKYNVELVENQFTKSDLKDGDKCTLKNGQVVFVDKTSKYCFENIDEQLKYFNDDVSIVKVERPVKYETLFERKEEILDEAEKKYLANVIRPFKDKIKGIVKISNFDDEYILIEVKDDGNIPFPYFKKGTMYKRMRPKKEYTLEELEL